VVLMNNNEYEYEWGSIQNVTLRNKWSHFAGAFSRQYEYECIKTACNKEDYFVLLIYRNKEIALAGGFRVRHFHKSLLRFHYVEFGVPLTVQRSMLKNSEVFLEDKIAVRHLLNEIFKEICRSLSAGFVLLKAISQEDTLFEFSMKTCFFLRSSPMWAWRERDSFEQYIQTLSKNRRKAIRKINSKASDFNLRFEVKDLESADAHNIAQISALMMGNMTKYGNNAEFDPLVYFDCLRRSSQSKIMLLQIRSSEEVVAFEVLSVSHKIPTELEVSLAGIDDSRRFSVSLYDMLFVNEVKWTLENIKGFSKCTIGQGCDSIKRSYGAYEEKTIAAVWFHHPVFRFFSNKISVLFFRILKIAHIVKYDHWSGGK